MNVNWNEAMERFDSILRIFFNRVEANPIGKMVRTLAV